MVGHGLATSWSIFLFSIHVFVCILEIDYCASSYQLLQWLLQFIPQKQKQTT